MTKSKKKENDVLRPRTPIPRRRERPRDLPPVIDKGQKGLYPLRCDQESSPESAHSPSWPCSTPVSPPVPIPVPAVDQRALASPKVVNLTYNLKSVKMRHHPAIGPASSDSKIRIPANVPYRIDKKEAETLWGTIRQRLWHRMHEDREPKTLSVTNIDGSREFCGKGIAYQSQIEGRMFYQYRYKATDYSTTSENSVIHGRKAQGERVCSAQVHLQKQEDTSSVCTITLLVDNADGGRELPAYSYKSATTTPSAPYSSTDLLSSYPGDTRLSSTDELRIGNGILTDRDSHQKIAELERRPSSRKDSKKSLSFNGYIEREKEKERERDSRDRHKDDSLPPNSHTKNYFKPMGMRNNFLSGQQIPASQRNVPPAPLNPTDKLNREPDDLVAMGTNWNPPPGSYSSSNQRNGHRPNSYGNGSGSQLSLTPSGSLAPVSGSRKIPGSYTRPSMYGQSLHNRQQAKDSDPKYSDPVSGAPPSFQQRIAELAAIEQETIRWEKARKMKKKPKDS